MKILFAGSYYYPSGGADDIVATNIKMSSLEELLEAQKSLGSEWWHVYDTVQKRIIKSGTFSKSKVTQEKRNNLIQSMFKHLPPSASVSGCIF